MHPAHETFPYYGFQLGALNLVTTGEGAERLAGGGFSPVLIRYAFPLYGTHAPLFPIMAADDRGAVYRGLAAFDWIAGRGLLFPRSDVMGLRADGSEDQKFLKELDLGIPAMAYASMTESAFPGHLLAAAIEVVSQSEYAITPGGDFPARLSTIVPVFQLHVDALWRASELLPAVLSNPRSVALAEV